METHSLQPDFGADSKPGHSLSFSLVAFLLKGEEKKWPKNSSPKIVQSLSRNEKFGKRGVQKSMGRKVPWKIGMLIYLPSL